MFTDSVDIMPLLFRKVDDSLYPADNWPDFESWFSQQDLSNDSDRIYLGVFFTSYYKNNCNYGNDKAGIKVLQDYLDTLDRSKKYYAICQWDDGILNDISHLDIKVFSMAGGRKDYGLPLICQPHRIKFNNTRDIFCSFVGRITNPVRQKIVDIYSGKPGYFVSTNNHSLPDYCRILSRSVFGLCPAGYGVNSFRIQECLEYGSIPVWVTKTTVPIHNLDFTDFGVLIKEEYFHKIDEMLHCFTDEEIKIKQTNGKYVFDRYYTFESNKKLILDNL